MVCGGGRRRCGSLGAPPGLPGLRPACYGSSCCQVAPVPLGCSHQPQPWSCGQWEAANPAPANRGQLVGKLGRDVTGPAPPSNGEDNQHTVSERRVWMRGEWRGGARGKWSLGGHQHTGGANSGAQQRSRFEVQVQVHVNSGIKRYL